MRRWINHRKQQARAALLSGGRALMLVATMVAAVLGLKFLSGAVGTALSVDTTGEALLWWGFSAVALAAVLFLGVEIFRRLHKITNR